MKSNEQFLSFTEMRVANADALRDIKRSGPKDRLFTNYLAQGMAVARIVSTELAVLKMQERYERGIQVQEEQEKKLLKK